MPILHVQSTLHALLDANARFDLGARGTTNHCPLALTALARMGASPERLQAFFDQWASRYALAAPALDAVIARDDWARHVGDRAAFGALRVAFIDWIDEVGHVAVITAVLHGIPFAPATLAFHALIRLAYGIDAAHRGEIASGLASLVSSHLPVDVDPDDSRPADTAEAGIKRVVDAMQGNVFAGDSITARLRAVAADPRFARSIQAPPADAKLLDALAHATVAGYWRTPNFTLLHTVTATHAARTVFSLLPEPLVMRLLPRFWIAICAACATVPIARVDSPHFPEAINEWETLQRMAVASDDDHTIKLTYTCFCEDQRDASPLYRASVQALFGE